MNKTIAIIGLGLIGGSLAKAIKENTPHTVLGMDQNSKVADFALSCGAIHAIASDADLQQADLVFLGLYPAAAVAFAEEKGNLLRKDAIICDVSGIKTWLCKKMPLLAERYGWTFVGTHPMAGKERNGFEYSEASLFQGASFIITPCGAPETAVQEVERLAMEMGFGGVVRSTPEEHDRLIAFTSQLPHVLACAYVLSPCCPRHKGFSAGSYRDVSRVARINETLWSELFLENRDPLLQEMDTLMEHLSQLRSAIADGDREAVAALLQRGRKIKEELGE